MLNNLSNYSVYLIYFFKNIFVRGEKHMKYAFEKNDFEIIEKNKHEYKTWFTVKCRKCGRVHSVSYHNFLKRKNTHEKYLY